MGKVGSWGKGWLPCREAEQGPIFGQVLLSLLTPINFLLMQHVLVQGGGRWWGWGGGRAGESLKPHNFSQLGNRGSPAGFSLRFSLNTAACFSCCPYSFWTLHFKRCKKRHKTAISYRALPLLSSLVSNSKTHVFRYFNYVCVSLKDSLWDKIFKDDNVPIITTQMISI